MCYIEKCLKVPYTQTNLCWWNIWYPRAHHSHWYDWCRGLLQVCRHFNCTPCTQITQLHPSTTALYLTVATSRNTEHILFWSHRTNEFLKAVAKSDYQPSKARPSVRTDNRDCHRTDFHEIMCVGFLLNFVHTLGFWLKSDQNNGLLRTGICKWNTWQMGKFMWSTWSVAVCGTHD